MPDLKDELASLHIDRSDRGGGSTPWLWLAIVVLVLLAAGGAGWWWISSVQAATVRVAQVEEAAAGSPGVLNASGYVVARRRATVSSKITGRVIDVLVDEGMAVKAGQVLARLDDTLARANLALAERELQAARTGVRESEVRLAEALLTLKRRDELAREGIVGQAELDAAQAEADSLRARVEAAREAVGVAGRVVALRQAELDDTVIRAPFSGVAISKDAQPGEMVSPISAGGGFTRTGICTIVDMSSLEIEVDVNEAYINRVTPDQPVTAVLDAYPDWQIPAHVITTVPTADRQKATVLVRIGLDALDPRLLPDMGVKVTFHAADVEPAEQTRPRLLVPKSAIRTANGGQVVFVVREGQLERRAVKLGSDEGELVEVLAGLDAGERVVVEGPAELRDGARVRTSQ